MLMETRYKPFGLWSHFEPFSGNDSQNHAKSNTLIDETHMVFDHVAKPDKIRRIWRFSGCQNSKKVRNLYVRKSFASATQFWRILQNRSKWIQHFAKSLDLKGFKALAMASFAGLEKRPWPLHASFIRGHGIFITVPAPPPCISNHPWVSILSRSCL